MRLYQVYCIISAVYGCISLNILSYLYLTRNARPSTCKFYCYKLFKYHLLPVFMLILKYYSSFKYCLQAALSLLFLKRLFLQGEKAWVSKFLNREYRRDLINYSSQKYRRLLSILKKYPDTVSTSLRY